MGSGVGSCTRMMLGLSYSLRVSISLERLGSARQVQISHSVLNIEYLRSAIGYSSASLNRGARHTHQPPR